MHKPRKVLRSSYSRTGSIENTEIYPRVASMRDDLLGAELNIDLSDSSLSLSVPELQSESTPNQQHVRAVLEIAVGGPDVRTPPESGGR